jgi:hypothetical protein
MDNKPRRKDRNQERKESPRTRQDKPRTKPDRPQTKADRPRQSPDKNQDNSPRKVVVPASPQRPVISRRVVPHPKVEAKEHQDQVDLTDLLSYPKEILSSSIRPTTSSRTTWLTRCKAFLLTFHKFRCLQKLSRLFKT